MADTISDDDVLGPGPVQGDASAAITDEDVLGTKPKTAMSTGTLDLDPMGNPTGISPGEEPPPPKKYANYPTLADFPISSPDMRSDWKPGLFGMPFANTPEGLRNIIAKHAPEAKFSDDEHGNPLVEYKGQKYHMARPDTLNAQDLSFGIAKSLPSLAGTAGAALVPGALPLSMGLQAAGMGGGSMVSDWLGQQAGSEENIDLKKAAIDSAIGGTGPLVGKGISKLFHEPTTFTALPRGAQSTVGTLRKPLMQEASGEAAATHDLFVHEPRATAMAERIMATDPDSAAAKIIENKLIAHADEAPKRIAADVDAALGPLDGNQRQLMEALKAEKFDLSPKLTKVLDEAPPIDVSKVVDNIDAAMAHVAPNSPQARALKYARSQLVEQEAEAGTRTMVNPEKGKGMILGQPGKERVLVSDARRLENARVAFDQAVKWGDPNAQIALKSVSPSDYVIKGVRQDLSRTLKDNIPGYADAMGEYAGLYEKEQAMKMAGRLFAKGDRTLYPEQVGAILASDEGPSFKMAARALIDRQMKTSPQDAAQILRMTGDVNDFARQNLVKIFGEDGVNALRTVAEREIQYLETVKRLSGARARGIDAASGDIYSKTQEPIMQARPDLTLTGIAHGAFRGVTNPVLSTLKGQGGNKAFSEGLGKFMTTPRNQALQDLFDAQGSTFLPPALSGMEGTINNMGLRRERASGGRTGFDHAAKGGELVASVEKMRKQHSAATKDFLKVDDDTVARALAAANEAI